MTKNTEIVLAVVVVALLTFGGIYWYNSNKKKDTAQKTADKIVEEANNEIRKSQNSKDVYIKAKTAYKVAQAKANEWSNDAKLIEITNFRGTKKQDGTSETWKIKFYSPSKDKDYSIYITDGKFHRDDNGRHTSLNEIPENWVDSDIVMKQAMQYLNEEECTNYWIGISGDTWQVKCDKANGPAKWIKIDATTGEKTGERVGY